MGIRKPSIRMKKKKKGDRLFLPSHALEVAKLPEQCFSGSNFRTVSWGAGYSGALASVRVLSPPVGPPNIAPHKRQSDEGLR